MKTLFLLDELRDSGSEDGRKQFQQRDGRSVSRCKLRLSKDERHLDLTVNVDRPLITHSGDPLLGSVTEGRKFGLDDFLGGFVTTWNLDVLESYEGLTRLRLGG